MRLRLRDIPKVRNVVTGSVPHSGICFVCGIEGEFDLRSVISPDLQSTWSLSDKEKQGFNERESLVCSTCMSTYRARRMAETIGAVYSPPSTQLSQVIDVLNAGKFKVAEINLCGALHPNLARLTNLYYSEYEPSDKTVEHQNIEDLSYDDNTFDLVLHSDTLEHVSDIETSMREVYRVLKPNALQIFTIPAILNRKSIRRARRDEDGKVADIEPRSFHGEVGDEAEDYVVMHEFGKDFVGLLESCGFAVRIHRLNATNPYDFGFVFVARKIVDETAATQKDKE